MVHIQWHNVAAKLKTGVHGVRVLIFGKLNKFTVTVTVHDHQKGPRFTLTQR
jgi:hypothetical protein